jgi:hypothetical protein
VGGKGDLAARLYQLGCRYYGCVHGGMQLEVVEVAQSQDQLGAGHLFGGSVHSALEHGERSSASARQYPEKGRSRYKPMSGCSDSDGC